MNQIQAVYGSSGYGREVMPLLRDIAQPSTELIFIDDAASGQIINGFKVLSFVEFLRLNSNNKSVSIAIADSIVREKLAIKCFDNGISFASVNSKSHIRMDECNVGVGGIFSPFTVLTSNIQIGLHFHCNIGSYVAHDCVIGNFVTFAPGVKCNGNIHIGDHAYIGTGAVIRQGTPDKPLYIGAGAVIGMGAVVTKDVPAGATVIGNPARQMQR